VIQWPAMRIALDGTPLLGATTGVGTYVRGLLDGLTGLGLTPVAVPFTLRGGGRPAGLADAVAWRHVPAPARLLQGAWGRVRLPPVELFAGRVDVFHATNFVAPPAVRAASVVTVHDLTFLRHPEWVTPAVARYRRLVPRSLRSGRAVVVTPSRAVADEVREAFGLTDDRVVATPLAVDPVWGRASPAEPAWLAGRGLPAEYVVFTGAREPRKNLATLLEAHRRARATGSVPDLVLVGPSGWGDGPGTGDAGVHVTGWLDRHELLSVVAGARASVLPSHYEGFGLPVLEAMAAGTPVLASDIPAHREVAGGFARLVAPADTDGWAEALLALAHEPAAPDPAARRWALSHTWTECARRTLDAYGVAKS
jgi:glycosyltransferase involved in cell wall biosynthesis